jgi:hypothetical protein
LAPWQAAAIATGMPAPPARTSPRLSTPKTCSLIISNIEGNVHALGQEAAMIGESVADHSGFILMKTGTGGVRIVDKPSGG